VESLGLSLAKVLLYLEDGGNVDDIFKSIHRTSSNLQETTEYEQLMKYFPTKSWGQQLANSEQQMELGCPVAHLSLVLSRWKFRKDSHLSSPSHAVLMGTPIMKFSTLSDSSGLKSGP
jgi:hypothetical protein